MEDTTSLFNYRDPRSLMADRYASSYEPLSGNLDQMTVQLGGNAGALLGNALFGGKTSKMAEQAVLNEAIKESEVAEDPDERLSLFAKALRKRGLEGYAQKAESQLLDRQKTKADIARLKSLSSGSGKGAGTGVERMLQHISRVDTALKRGEAVSEEDISLANLYRESMAQRKTYQMPDGSIVTIDVKDFEGQRQVENSGGVLIPSPVSSTAAAPQTASAPGVRVTETPASQTAKAKAEEGKRQEQVVFESDINQIDKALNIVQTKGRMAAGYGSMLSFIPESSASELADTIQSIDAAKLIQQIQALKSTSATGATGFGSLTEKEGLQLINRLGSIKQTKSPEKLAEALLEVRTLLSKLAGKEAAPRGSTQTQYSSAQEADIAEFMAANPGKSREATIKFMKRNNLIK